MRKKKEKKKEENDSAVLKFQTFGCPISKKLLFFFHKGNAYIFTNSTDRRGKS